MKTIKLLGELGKKFGKLHRFDVNSPAEAIRALCANFKGFEAHLMNSDPEVVRYQVVVGKETVPNENHLHDPIGGADVIKFVPVLVGAKGGGGLIQTIVGAVLIVVGFALSFTPFAAASPYLYAMGVSMMIGGVAQMLTPSRSPTMGSTSYEEAENNPSYTFDGPINTEAQGHPVPIGYGRMIVGSAVISAGIVAADI